MSTGFPGVPGSVGRRLLTWRQGLMKVFIGWSGARSHQLAMVLRDWIRWVHPAVEPYVSSEDIVRGVRGNLELGKELADYSFRILCVTAEILDALCLPFGV